MQMTEKEYSLNELAREYSDNFPWGPVNVRTLRFYISEGLLPGPGRVGPGKHYSEDHMVLLETIRSMQQTGTSISSIRQMLSSLSPHQMLENLAIQQEILQNKNSSVERTRSSPVDSGSTRLNAIREDAFEEGESLKHFRISSGVEIIINEELAFEHRAELIEWVNTGKSIFSRGGGR
jgi:DNA-binding transcriptional MerR regulator